MTDYQELEILAKAATSGPWSHGGTWVSTAKGNSVADCQRGDEKFIAAANPTVVLAMIEELKSLRGCDKAYAEVWEKARALQSDLDDYQQGAKAEADAGDEARAEVRRLKAEVESLQLRATLDLQKLLPGLSDALEDLEMHGRHSDQGYRKLQDWYRKMEMSYRVLSAPMFGAEHADLVSQNTWLRKMVGHQSEQHAPMEPINDPEGWSRRLPGYDLPALLRDADRYRWLMSQSVYNGTLGIRDGWIDFEDKEIAQEQIDRAMREESGNGQAT